MQRSWIGLLIDNREYSARGLLKGTRDMDAHMSLALPTNRERATDRLATRPEDARERRQARVRARRVQRLASERAEERKRRLCRRREGERNRRASESEETREHRLARDRACRRQRRATAETAQERETRRIMWRERTQRAITSGSHASAHAVTRFATPPKSIRTCIKKRRGC